jgi:aminobenzoyl-glutamate utilization protein B
MRLHRAPLLAAIAAAVLAASGASAPLAAQVAAATTAAPAPRPADARIEALKREVAADVDARAKMIQVTIDMLFSFGELGFQEQESSRYLTELLERNGFRVERGVAGIPTAWVATWGSGKPVIALGSDIDGIPQASQKPGVAYRAPLVEGAPGHGEGHNSGLAVVIAGALAAKRIMERDHMPGTLKIWPGVAEELVATKAYLVREGVFRDADAAIFTHVGRNLETAWGDAGSSTGLVSVEYSFLGETAHSAGNPARGRSALDAVELMNVGWNYRREHLGLAHRSHYVIRNGGDQPNVVPRTASVWYYLRDVTEPRIRALWALADSMAQGATLMTGTRLAGTRVLGSAWPQHFNRPIAEAMYENIRRVGLPQWSEADQTLARAVQKEIGVRETGLQTELSRLAQGTPPDSNRGGGSDDIGDVTWTVPTVTLRYPSNIPNLPGHNWADAIAMATPIAHKGAVAGAKVTAMTLVDLLTDASLRERAWSYFRDVQTKDVQYRPLIRAEDRPAVEMNTEIMARYRPQMRRFYYDPSRYGTYLEQLGITYPTVRAENR